MLKALDRYIATCIINLLELIAFRIFVYVIFEINSHQLLHGCKL